MGKVKISSVIKKIVDLQGVDILLDSRRFWAFFNDLYLDSAQTKKIFQRALTDTVLKKFYDIYFASSSSRRELLTKVKHYLSNDLGFSEDWANTVVVSFSDAFNWGYKATVVAKSHTPSKTKPSSSNTSTSTSVDLSFLIDDSFDFSDPVPISPITTPAKIKTKRNLKPVIILGSVLLVLILSLALFFGIRSASAKNDIALILEAAELAVGSNNFDEAIALVEDGLNEYPNSELLLDFLTSCTIQRTDYEVTKIITEAETLIQREQFDDAIATVQQGIDTYPDCTTLLDSLEKYTTAKKEFEVSRIIADANALANEENYKDAIAVIRAGLETYPNCSPLTSILSEYKDLGKNQAIANAESLAETGDYLHAMELIQNAKSLYGSSKALQDAYEDYRMGHATSGITKTFSGVYNTFVLRSFDLEFLSCDKDGNVSALFSFYSTDPKDTLFGCYEMEGNLTSIQSDGSLIISLTGTEWRVQPSGYHMINFDVTINPEKTVIKSDDYEVYGVDTSATGVYNYENILKTYSGTYMPNWGVTCLDIRITSCNKDTGKIEADCSFYPHEHNPETRSGSFKMDGQIIYVYDDGSVKIAFTGKEWIEKPDNTIMLDFIITIDAACTEAISDSYQINLHA